MAERKPGPVKPPVIDLTARPAEAAKPSASATQTPQAKASPKAIETPKVAPTAEATAKEREGTATDASKPASSTAATSSTAEKGGSSTESARQQPTSPPRPADSLKARPPVGLWPMAGAGLGGAIIAIAICYGLAQAGLWPAGPTVTTIDQRLTQAEQANSAAGAKLAQLSTRLDTLQSDVAAKLATANSTLASMQTSLKALQAPSADLAGIQNQVKTLSSRLDAIAAGASSADAGALAANLATAQQNLAALSQKVDSLANRASATDTAVTALKSDLASAKAAIDKAAAAPSPQQIAAAMQLPILISAVDADFSAGRPYADDLKALKAAIPEMAIPATIASAATSGLPAAAEVVANFEAKMPDMIAAEPGSSAAGWQGQIADWARGVLALRRQGAEQGNGPDAMLSQLEAAVSRHDFASAAALLGKLPQPMQKAAGDAGRQILTLADADAFIGSLRQTALKPVAGSPS